MKMSDRELRLLLADLVEASAMSLLDPDRLQAIAEDLRVVERHRGYDAGLVALSIVLSALQRSTDTQGRLADARQVYGMLGGGATTESGFRKVARKIGPVLREILNRRLGTIAAGVADPELRGRLSALRDVLIPDGCAFKLASKLAGTYAGTGQPSEMKFHAVYSVRAGGAVALNATAGAVHDNDGFAPQEWVPGSLYIWDLGYNDYGRVVAATKAGAFVLQRLKAGANPRVLASFGPGGHRRELHSDDGGDIRLDDACAMGLVHRQRILDLDIELREDGETAVVRVVCVPFGGEDRYYLTTLARTDFSPHDIAELYRLRWEIELFFRGLKGATRLDEVRRLENEESLHAIVYGSLFAALLARDITAKLNELEIARYNAEHASTEAFPPAALCARCATRGGSRGAGVGLQRERADEGTGPADDLRGRLAARSRLSPHHRPHERHAER
jgi:hypothetical protein